MPGWRRYPTLYEINTWVWLGELSEKQEISVDLSSVPATEWDALAKLGVDAVWLMGVWERSPAGIAISNRNPNNLADFTRALPDFRPEDNVGSPYCVRQYVVDPHLGGPEGLALAREQLARRGLRLVLDFVPNHVAPDHPWVADHPECFIQGTADEARNDPASYVVVGENIFACGKDPYFPAWGDVLQLNAFAPGLRRAVHTILSDIARQCDGVRCDMAMLLLNSIFQRTWGNRAGPQPAGEYWSQLISAIKREHPDFLFIAEAYWDLEWELQQKGFDFCYDKRLYDRLVHDNAESVRLHLCADPAYQDRLLRFLENHDEPRAAATFSPAKEHAAAVVTSTLSGARMFHEGQFEGRNVRLPVFLGRRPQEPVDRALQDFYHLLLEQVADPLLHEGEWRMCERTGWPDNQSFENVVAWRWARGSDLCLIVVNLSDHAAQANVVVAEDTLRGKQWQLNDMFSGAVYERSGDQMSSPGLYVDLQPWSYHFLRFSAATGLKNAAARAGRP
jgi:Alpha amylase, catalytic domain